MAYEFKKEILENLKKDLQNSKSQNAQAAQKYNRRLLGRRIKIASCYIISGITLFAVGISNNLFDSEIETPAYLKTIYYPETPPIIDYLESKSRSQKDTYTTYDTRQTEKGYDTTIREYYLTDDEVANIPLVLELAQSGEYESLLSTPDKTKSLITADVPNLPDFKLEVYSGENGKNIKTQSLLERIGIGVFITFGAVVEVLLLSTLFASNKNAIESDYKDSLIDTEEVEKQIKYLTQDE